MNDNINLSSKQIKLITLTLLTLMTLIGMAVDLISPSLPGISKSLHASPSIVQNTMSFYLIGYALGNFITGVLTDSFGRRKLLLFSLIGFIVASLSAAISIHIAILLLMRFLQGLMIGGTAATLRGALADILPPKQLVSLGTLMCMMWGLGAITGPLIGGYLQVYIGWQANFYFFSLIGVLELITIFIVVPETYTNFHPLGIKFLKKDFSKFVTNLQFITLSFLMGLSYASVIIFNTAGPFLIQNKLHYSAIQFGKMALYLMLFYIFSTLICRYLLTKFNSKQLLCTGITIFFLVTLVAIIVNNYLSNNIIFIILISAVMFFACGFIFSLSLGLGISIFRQIAGTATAAMYLISSLITSIGASLVSLINVQNSISLMWSYVFLMTISALIYFIALNKTDLTTIHSNYH